MSDAQLSSSDARVAEANESTPNDCEQKPFVLPPEHRRNRKSWTAEEKEAFWKTKKLEKKARKKSAAAERQHALKVEWEQLSEDEKERRKKQATQVYDERRTKALAHEQQCQRHLADPSLPVLVFDLSFAWTMTVPDTKSTASQLKLSYSSLRHAGFPMRPVLTSLMGREAQDTLHDSTAQAAVLSSSLVDFPGFTHYPPRLTDSEHWSALFPTDKTIFLTADSETVLETIEPDHVYVVGAFVDHNQHKGLSLTTATRHGVRTARLPIQESIALGNRCKVLTINHVVSALVRYMDSRDWSTAFEQSLPTRRARQVEDGSSRRRRTERRQECEHSHDGDDGDDGDGDAENADECNASDNGSA